MNLAFAQKGRSQSGCLVSGGNVYTTPEGSLVNAILGLLVGPGYKGNPIPEVSECINYSQIVYVPNNLQNCRVCPTTAGFTIVIPGVLVTCGVPVIDGNIATATIVDCPLDDYFPFFGIMLSAFGFFIIKKRIIQHSL